MKVFPRPSPTHSKAPQIASRPSDGGFTLIEVLIAILMATSFTLIALEAIVLATVYKVRSRQTSEISNWIKEDYEEIKLQAYQYGGPTSDPTSPTFVAYCNQTNPAVGWAADFRNYVANKGIGTGTPNIRTLIGGQFQLTRTTAIYDASFGRTTTPYNALKVFYDVREIRNGKVGKSVAYVNTEIVPSITFQCGYF